MTHRILITSALPYVNGIKHLGNFAGSILPADVYARFQRLRGRDVLFVCGTDEHGTPAELASLEAGLPVADYCARQHAAQAEIYRQFDISFDHFGRSSSSANHALTQDLFLRLEANGFIEERVVQQVWSNADSPFCRIAISWVVVPIVVTPGREAISVTIAAGCSMPLS